MSEGLRLLSAICTHQGVEYLREAQRELFVGEVELEAYDYLVQHFRRYSTIPSHAALEESTDIELPHNVSEPIKYYMDKVQDRALYNRVRPEYDNLRDALRDNDPDEIRERIASMTAACRISENNSEVATLGEAGALFMQHYEAHRYDCGVTGVPSGYESIDLDTGGYQNGDLVTWVGRPRMGKTYILLNQALTAWRLGYKVLVCSMELPLQQCAFRTYAIHSRINPTHIKNATLDTYSERKLQHSIDLLEHDTRFTLYAGSFSKKVAELHTLVQEIGPDVIFVDGIYLMKSSENKRMGRYEEAAYVLDELKVMALTTNRPVVCTSQQNKDAGNKGESSSLNSIGYTDAVAQHSSLVYAITPGQSDTGKLYTGRVIENLKSRDGVGDYRFAINYTFAPIDFGETKYDDSKDTDDDQNVAGRPMQQTVEIEEANSASPNPTPEEQARSTEIDDDPNYTGNTEE